MGMRPVAATWFEVLMPRAQLTRALRSLAASGAVELQTYSQTTTASHLPDLRRGLEEYGEIRQRYGTWWPAVEPQSVETAEEPPAQLAAAIDALRGWVALASDNVTRLQEARTRAAELALIREAIDAGRAQLPDLQHLTRAGTWLDRSLHLLPPRVTLTEIPHGLLTTSWSAAERRFLVLIGRAEAVAEMHQKLAALRARPLRLPEGLPATADEAVVELGRQIEDCEATVRSELEALDKIAADTDLSATLGRIRLLEWYALNVPALPATEHFAWITGWTSDPEGESLKEKLERAKIRYLLRLSEPPAGAEPPSVLRNPFWARPFELFAGLLGTPDVTDVDPSRVLALIAPLMFGYMFGDVGQGAVLLAAGLLLKDRVPALSLLVPGGISAILFGFLFGSVFGIEDLLPALWLHPLEHPLTILGVSLGFGVAVVALGILLDTLQCHWRGESRRFWGSRVGIPVTYLGLLLAFVDTRALWLIVLGGIWYIAGAVRLPPEQGGEPASAAAMDYGETLLQLAVNTVSFVRVGAFALAHGGLSAAVLGIAEAADSTAGQLLVLVVGNALVIALEGLVVSIQTTRLVLFEFFVRFLRASGRRFCPLPNPTGIDEQLGRNPR
jgi:V/A-type H+-transporting ATPase subunit I